MMMAPKKRPNTSSGVPRHQVRRQLFPSDSKSPENDTDAWLDEKLNHISERDKRRWNFDFEADRPETSGESGADSKNTDSSADNPGAYSWAAVPAKDVPQVYRPSGIPPAKDRKTPKKRKEREGSSERAPRGTGSPSKKPKKEPPVPTRRSASDGDQPSGKKNLVDGTPGGSAGMETPNPRKLRAPKTPKTGTIKDYFPVKKHSHNLRMNTRREYFPTKPPAPKRSNSSPGKLTVSGGGSAAQRKHQHSLAKKRL